MKSELNIACPISTERINSTVVRIIAVLITIIAFLALLLDNYLITSFLIFDFFSRAFLAGKGSLLKVISLQLSNYFQLKIKLIDAAPKVFAAKIGFIFSVVIFVSQLFQLHSAAFLAGGILIVCAALEGLFGLCLGCYFYTIGLFFKIKQ